MNPSNSDLFNTEVIKELAVRIANLEVERASLVSQINLLQGGMENGNNAEAKTDPKSK